MSIIFGNSFITIDNRWQNFISTSLSKSLPLQYYEDENAYTIFSIDSPIVYITNIFKNSVLSPNDYSQAQNDGDKTDWEMNFKSGSNIKMNPEGSFDDPRIIHRFGNLTSLSTSEVLVSTRPYTEPASQAQRSVVSTSATDNDGLATGARKVRITFLNSNYVKKIEDVALSGTTGVNTVATDIRFIEKFEVIKGTDAVGAIKLMTGINGSGTEICGIGAATSDAFLCHHYIPSGYKGYIFGWGAVVNDDANFKLKGQNRVNGVDLVDQILDLDNLSGITAGTRLEFSRKLNAVFLPEKTYIRITTVPGQATSTVIRSFLDIWETKG